MSKFNWSPKRKEDLVELVVAWNLPLNHNVNHEEPQAYKASLLRAGARGALSDAWKIIEDQRLEIERLTNANQD